MKYLHCCEKQEKQKENIGGSSDDHETPVQESSGEEEPQDYDHPADQQRLFDHIRFVAVGKECERYYAEQSSSGEARVHRVITLFRFGQIVRTRQAGLIQQVTSYIDFQTRVCYLLTHNFSVSGSGFKEFLIDQ